MEPNQSTVAGDIEVGSKGSTSLSFVNEWVSEYKAKQQFFASHVLALPSGKSVEVIRMPLSLMYQRGLIPDLFTARVQEWIETIQKNIEDPINAGKEFINKPEETQAEMEKRYKDWLEILDYTWCACVSSPKFCMKEEDQNLDTPVLWVGEVDYQDKIYVYTYAQGVDQTVEEFFREQEEALGAILDGEGIRDQTQQLLRVERKGGKLAGVYDRPSDVHVGHLLTE